MEKMMNKEEVKYNTWLLKVNLDNVKSNYDRVQEYGEAILIMSDYDLKKVLKTEFSYHDKIDWNYVNIQEIRESLADMI